MCPLIPELTTLHSVMTSKRVPVSELNRSLPSNDGGSTAVPLSVLMPCMSLMCGIMGSDGEDYRREASESYPAQMIVGGEEGRGDIRSGPRLTLR